MNRVYPSQRGSSGRMLQDLAKSFAREGWQVTVITSGAKSCTERDGAVKVIRLKASDKPAGLIGYVWIWMRMFITALRLPPTHLLVTMTDPPMLAVIGQIVSKFKKNRHIHWCQDLYPDILPSLGFKAPGFILSFLKKLSRKAMKSADKVIVIGRCMARHLSRDGFDPRQITVIPNWPDFELVKAKEQENNPDTVAHSVVSDEELYRDYAEQRKYGPKFRVLYAGNIGRAHPIDTILEAAEELNNDENNDIEFVFVGDGPRYDELALKRSSRHLDNIRLLPYQPQAKLKELMESGDVHLVSMNEQAAGMLVPCKLYSALAAKRPCILVGPAHSETAKVITDFHAGSVIAQGQAQTLANEIRRMRFDSDTWHGAYQGAVRASEIFLPQESIDAWMERAWAVVEADLR